MKTMLQIDIENLREKYDELEQTSKVREDQYQKNLGQLQETLKEATKQVQSLANQFENKEKQLDELRDDGTNEKNQLQTKLDDIQ